MKKIIITVILAIGFVAAVAAQPKAIGGRLGWGLDLSYEHNVGSKANFMEASLGLYGFTGLQLGATYNFMIAQPEWTTKGTWGFYAGPGATLGMSFFGPFNVGLMGQIGLEYTFDIPLQLSVDLRPHLGIGIYQGGIYFNAGGLFGFVPSLAVRYAF